MTKIARIEAETGAGARVAGPRVQLGTPRREARSQYYAFLSYSHKDEELAEWLHGELEEFHVPAALAGRLTANGVIPRKLAPIFRDKQELAAASDLGEEIRTALAASQFLVVLCSPAAAASRWTNAEIEAFKRSRPDGCVLAVIASGEPFASDDPGREAEECFPPALRERYDKRGRATGKRAEPIAADLRGDADDRRLGFLRLVAGMLGVGLDDLVRRETTRKQRRLAWVTGGSLAGMVFASGLAITAIQARDAARDQRREAEGLIGFMLGDLKDKLEPIGKLDALDGVGTRVLAYYHQQDTAELSDAALSMRSRALSLMAEVASQRSDPAGAISLYREAMAGTSEAILRNPDDPQRLFDHAQNVFYVGQISRQRGDISTAETSLREYKRLARRMVALGPDSLKWRMEEQYADFNLGVILFDQRQFGEAATQFKEALRTIEAISTADRGNREYRKSIGESLAWLADAKSALGQYDEALAARLRDIEVLDSLLAEKDDVDYRQRLVPAHRVLGELYVERGERELGIEHFRAAIAFADALTSVEPDNTQWLEHNYRARGGLAKQLIATGQTVEAASATGYVCQAVRKLLTLDARKPESRKGLVTCSMLQAKLALKAGSKQSALGFARRAVDAAQSVHTGDSAGDVFLVAKASRLMGDIQHGLGNAKGAHDAWTKALARLPTDSADLPSETAERAILLQRLGRVADAREHAARLAAIGYRDPEFKIV